jgi:hypothetical protein
MYIAEAKFNGAHLAFIWDINEACPGHFLQIFEPLDHVIFATNASRYVLDKNAKIVYENSWAVFTWTLMMNNIPKAKFGHPGWSTIEYNMYSRYFPTREVMGKVNEFVRAHNICQASAMHLRLTDMSQHLEKKRKAVNINGYFRFVESRPKDEPVYLLTDNPTSQRLFLEKYGPKKILVYRRIPSEDDQKPLVVSYKLNSASASASANGTAISANTSASTSTSSGTPSGDSSSTSRKSKLPEDHRFTSIEHTLIDVLIAAHSRDFKPGIYSSLSDLVHMFARIGKSDRGWCR